MKLNRSIYLDRVSACWIGKNIGGTMGAPYEGDPNMQNISGFANERTGNTVRFGYNSGSDFDEAIRVSGISVIVYDESQREGNKVYVGSVNDVVGYKNAGDECSSVLVHTYHSQPRQIIVYN